MLIGLLKVFVSLQVIKPPPRKRCVIELHERLLFLLNELEPWETKLCQATRRARVKMRKEYESYKEEEPQEVKPSVSSTMKEGRNILFNNALNTFYLRLYGVRHMVNDHSDNERGNLMSDSFRLTARVLLYAPSHRQDNTYHSLCCTSRGALAGTRNSSMGPP